MKAKAKTKTPAKAKPAKESIADERAFVSVLIHELRTPLTALRGSLGLLAGAVEEADPEVQNFAGIADRNADKLASMLDDAAEYSRLNDATMPVTRINTDVVDTVHRAIEQVQSLVDERGVVLDVQTTPTDANVDPVLVRIAVARLLSYAVRVSPKKSTLHIAVETTGATGTAGGRPAQAGGTAAVVSVSDCGKVIAAENAARMFEPFSGVARRSLEPTMRTGLGLCVALKIARLHGGSLVFTPTEQGGVFSLRLPV